VVERPRGVSTVLQRHAALKARGDSKL
jgi:hypothetical protein